MSQQASQSHTDRWFGERQHEEEKKSIRLYVSTVHHSVQTGAGEPQTRQKDVNTDLQITETGGIEEVLPGNTSTANTHDRMMKHTELYMLPKQSWFWSAGLFYRRSFCISPQQGFRELPTLLSFLFVCLFPECQLAFHPHLRVVVKML